MPRKKQDEITPVVIPCDGCTHESTCKKHRLACRDFQNFVNQGVVRTPEKPDPTWTIFDDIYTQVQGVINRGNKHPGRN
jgi:hypothetical protein